MIPQQPNQYDEEFDSDDQKKFFSEEVLLKSYTGTLLGDSDWTSLLSTTPPLNMPEQTNDWSFHFRQQSVKFFIAWAQESSW